MPSGAGEPQLWQCVAGAILWIIILAWLYLRLTDRWDD
jgi:hypothetical protein